MAFLLYWGWYWRPVYDSAFLIVAQLVFAYAFDMLLCWSRRDTYVLGFGPFPVILSINLFLWFVDDWFFLQFSLIALGFAAKELIQWNKQGQQVHIFNPSSFPLAVFSLALILTGTSDLTWGQDIAITQFFPPHVYLVLFLVGLPGQYLFGVASMTMSAVIATYAFGLLYFAATGVYFFYDSYIPVAVFLGMHLLFTDPSTAPRSEVARIMFGVLYGLSTVALYALLGYAGVPTFYDKLLFVPVLNLSVQLLDRLTLARWLRQFERVAFDRSRSQRQRNLAYIVVWAAVFSVMSAVQGVGDRHPGQWVPFWQEACSQGRTYACSYLADMQETYCRSGSGWACNEAGILHIALARSGTGSSPAQCGQTPQERSGVVATLASAQPARTSRDWPRGSTHLSTDNRRFRTIRSSCAEPRDRSRTAPPRRYMLALATRAGTTRVDSYEEFASASVVTWFVATHHPLPPPSPSTRPVRFFVNRSNSGA